MISVNENGKSEEFVYLYRLENPQIKNEDPRYVKESTGRWFATNLDFVVTTPRIIQKAVSKLVGEERIMIKGGQLVIACIPANELDNYSVKNIAPNLHFDPEAGWTGPPRNFLVPRDGSVKLEIISLEELLGDEAYEKLVNCEGVEESSEKILRAVAEIIQ